MKDFFAFIIKVHNLRLTNVWLCSQWTFFYLAKINIFNERFWAKKIFILFRVVIASSSHIIWLINSKIKLKINGEYYVGKNYHKILPLAQIIVKIHRPDYMWNDHTAGKMIEIWMSDSSLINWQINGNDLRISNNTLA